MKMQYDSGQKRCTASGSSTKYADTKQAKLKPVGFDWSCKHYTSLYLTSYMAWEQSYVHVYDNQHEYSLGVTSEQA